MKLNIIGIDFCRNAKINAPGGQRFAKPPCRPLAPHLPSPLRVLGFGVAIGLPLCLRCELVLESGSSGCSKHSAVGVMSFRRANFILDIPKTLCERTRSHRLSALSSPTTRIAKKIRTRRQVVGLRPLRCRGREVSKGGEAQG